MSRVAKTEENAAPAIRDAKAGAKMSLLQQGSKRRAVLGDIGNSLVNRSKAASSDAAMKPSVRAAVAAPIAAVPAPDASAPSRAPALRTTRSQTAALRQQTTVGSMSSVLETRSTQAVAPPRPKSAAIPSVPLIDIDKHDHSDPLTASEYVNDIYSWYRSAETKFRIKPDFISRQTEVNEKMRAILCDWLVEVHTSFKLMPESLYLTINLVDRFLELKQVNRKNLQLVGVTAMLIASKYEEIWAPEVKDFVHISDQAYTRQQILSMEKLMLNALGFTLTVATPYNFLVRFLKAAGVNKCPETVYLATYLVELSLPTYGMLKYRYSAIACAAVYTAMRAGGRTAAQAFPKALASHSGYSEAETLPVAAQLVQLMQQASTAALLAIFKKYSSSKHGKAAERLPPLKILEEAQAL